MSRYSVIGRDDGTYGIWDGDKGRWANRKHYQKKGEANGQARTLELKHINGGGK